MYCKAYRMLVITGPGFQLRSSDSSESGIGQVLKKVFIPMNT